MATKFLDYTGLSYLWGKFKEWCNSIFVTKATDEDITGTKTFLGSKKIAFKQSGANDKLGFTLYNNSNKEQGYLEYNPTNKIANVPLFTLGNYATAANELTYIGFRRYSNISGASGAYNLLAPLISDAKTPFNLTTTYTNFYLPLGISDGTNIVTASNSGVIDISSFLTLTGYTKPSTGSALATTDTISEALGKLEAKVDAVNDSNYVHKTGNEVVAGDKSFTGFIVLNKSSPSLALKNTDISKGTKPSSTKYSNITWTDTDGTSVEHRLGLIETSIDTDGNTSTYLRAYKNASGSSTGVSMGVSYNYDASSGYTFAPTPATADNSSKIATTAFVKAQGYLTSHQSLSNYVTLNGTQTITGSKSFIFCCSKSTAIDRTVTNTTDDQWLISGVYHDKNDKGLIDIGFHRSSERNWSLRLYDSSGTQHWMMFQGMKHDGTSTYVSVGGDFYPMNNGDKYCGLSSRRWKAVYAVNGAIQTSDERIKEDIDKLPEAVFDAWESIEWLQFRMKPSIEKKGDSARLHSGIIAQHARDAFASVGLNASDYGFFCWDQWDKTPAMLDEKGEVAIPEIPAGDQYSIRYDEALAIEAAYQRRKNKILENRISELERQVSDMLQILQSLKGAN